MKLRIQGLIAIVKKIADVKCAQDLVSVGYMKQTRLDSQEFEMIVENVPAGNLLFNRSVISPENSKN